MTPAQIAAELNRLQAQGLTIEQAAEQVPGATALLESGGLIINDVAGSDNPNRGQVEVFQTGFARRENVETVVPNRANPYPEEPATPRTTTPVSTTTTTTTEETVTGGSVTTTRVTPTTYRDTAESTALQSQADAIQAQQNARREQLRAEGKTGAEILRDPEMRQLSQQRQSLLDQAQEARAVDQEGTVSVTREPGANTTVYQQTVSSGFQTNSTTGNDPTAEAGEDSRYVASGGPVDANTAEAVPIGQDAYVDLQDSGENITQLSGPVTEPVPAVDPYEVDGFTGALNTAELEEPPAVGRNVTTAYNPETGLYDVVDLDNGEVLAEGRTELEAQIDAAELESGDLGAPTEDEVNDAFLPESDVVREPTEQDAAGYPDPDAPGSAADAINAQLDSPDNTGERERDTLRAAQNIRELRQQSTGDAPGDWRVRLRLAPLSTYLYNDPNNTLLKPLASTDGVIFPYTPQISTVYHANYNAYDLTHSNYRGYFYQNSYVGEIQIQATFTAQDTQEAEYLLAVIHFFRSATKMFYGGGNGKPDEQIGSPPPLVFLNGLGDYQFAEHPCVITQFNYNLPNDVDYLRVASPSIVDTNLQNRRPKQATTPTGIGSILSLAGLSRLAGIGASPGAARPITVFNPGNLSLLNGSGTPTYVPSKIDINLVLLPMQSRKAASQQASLRDFAAGNLLKGGFW